MSSGRFPDGGGPFRRLSKPTPRSANASPLAAVTPQITTKVDALTGALQLTWTSQIGAVYRVEFKRELDDPKWEAVGTTQIGSGQSLAILLPQEDTASGFYRIVTE